MRNITWKLIQFLYKLKASLIPYESIGGRIERIIIQALHNVSRLNRKENEIVINSTKFPLVTVVIPIYDRTDILRESIESILRQSFQNFELILVCDGSPAETLEVVRDFEKNNPKIRAFFYKNNSGNAARGRNKGIKEARGEYLVFQDTDDIADLDRIKNSLEALEKNNVDIVYGGWRALVDGSRDIDIKNGQMIFSPDFDIETLIKTNVLCQSTVMAKINCLRAVGGVKTNMLYREDHELWLRLAYNGYKFKAIHKILTNLRLHQNNLEISFKKSDDYWYSIMLEEYKKNQSMKPKIGYVIPSTDIFSGSAVICQHANRLLLRGYDVALISADNNDSISWFPNQLVEIIPLEKASHNYDILVATEWSTADMVEKLSTPRKLYFVHSDKLFSGDNDDTTAYPKTLDSFKFDFEYITDAEDIQKWLKSEFNKDSTYIPNGLDEKIFYPVTPIVRKGIKTRVLLMGTIDSPLNKMAGYFEAFKELDCEVWCISMTDKPEPELACERFFTELSMDQMKYIYSSCAIFFKRGRLEVFFDSILGAMACGCAVVVEKKIEQNDYLIDGQNALIVAPGDAEDAKQAINKLIMDRALRARLIENGYKTVKERNWDRSINVLENVIEQQVLH